jgi:cytosine/adenosine deaminase-related metal-dependent hydrolase
MGGAKALRLDHRIGSLTPGKQADLAMIDLNSFNTFLSMPGGDPAHAVVMYAEASDVDNVMIAGRFVKRNGKLLFAEDRLKRVRDEMKAARARMMREGNYVYKPAPRGPQPEKWAI